jgi:hypothetical protein
MSEQDKPENDAPGAETDELARAFRALFSAMERGDLAGVAAALGQVQDPPRLPVWPRQR